MVGWTFYTNPTESLLRTVNEDKPIAEAAEVLKGILPAGAKVASDSYWGEVLHLSFESNLRYYGTPRPGQRPDQIAKELKRLGVQYYIVRYNEGPARAGWKRVSTPGLSQYRIFEVPTD